MPAEITLRVSQGPLTDQVYTFDDRSTCIIGRASDCNIPLPDDEAHRKISRHHCLLDINPPDITVRDFGSLNGTYVNGVKIGQRARGQTPEAAAQQMFPEHALKAGDEIKLSGTVFRVSLYVPLSCPLCGAELPTQEEDPKRPDGHLRLCGPCSQQAVQVGPGHTTITEFTQPTCAKCGKNVTEEVGQRLHGVYLCVSCQADWAGLVKFLMEQAAPGRKDGRHQDVKAIEGLTIEYALGQGGMGAVYLARRESNGEEVALKMMLPRVAVSTEAKALFLREIEHARALHHPHVVALHEPGFSHGMFYFTMEYCDRGNLKDLMLDRGGTLSIDEALVITFQVLEGLDYIHQAEIPNMKLKDGRLVTARGLVHRDLKPMNIFLKGGDRDYVAKVGDVGLAKAFDQAGLSGLTRTGRVGGTPGFMPRQQVTNFKYAKPEVDVWAAVASLYYMLTGVMPRDFPPKKDMWLMVLQTPAVPIRRRLASIPRSLAEVIDEALRDKPTIPFKTAGAFKRALEGIL